MKNNIGINLHIHEDLLAGEILKESVASFVDAMKGLTSDLADGQDWLFSVESGSALLKAVLSEDVDNETQSRIVSDIQDVIVDISQGNEPRILSEKTMQSIQKLTNATSKIKEVRASLEIRSTENGPVKIIDIKPYYSKRTDRQLSATPSISKVNGVVKGIHGAREHYLDVYEDFTNRRVKVKFDNRFSNEAIGDLYMRRVHVVGTVSLDNSGTRVFTAATIETIPTREEIPLWSDLAGILAR